MIFGNTLVATFNGKGGSSRKERSTASGRSTLVPVASKVAAPSRSGLPVLREPITTEERTDAAAPAAALAPRPDQSPRSNKHLDSSQTAAGDPWLDGFDSVRDTDVWFGPGGAAGLGLPGACRHLASRLERGLAAAKAGPLSCDTILVPERLLERVARLVVRAAEREPCGLAGAVVHILLLPPPEASPPHPSPPAPSFSSSAGTCGGGGGGGGGGGCGTALHVARLELDSGRAPTFEVSVLLRRERAWRWSDALLRVPPLPLSACLRRLAAAHASSQRTVRLGSGFKIVKRKLYHHPEEPCAVEEDDEEEDASKTSVTGRGPV